MKKQITDTLKGKHYAVEMVSARLTVYDKDDRAILTLDKKFPPFIFTGVDKLDLAWHIVGDKYVPPTRWQKLKAWLK